MQENNWRIIQLSEFLPRGKSLLGMNTNKGQLIQIRLRTGTPSSNSFIPFEAIVGTVLHELVHNSISRHDARFRRKLEQVSSRCESLMLETGGLRVITDCGEELGGDTDVLSLFSQRELMLFAAESRLALSLSRCVDVIDLEVSDDDP